MKTKCLIVDDEPLARNVLRNFLGKLENFEIVAECSDCMQALQMLRGQRIDLMFMDIHMPQISGIEFLKLLKNPPKVIITTAHSEYALKSFEFDIIDYLLKPFAFDRFFRAINKYLEVVQEEKATVYRVPEVFKTNEQCIYVKENKKAIKLNLSEIVYVEGLSEYVQIFTDKRRIVTKTSLSFLEEKLPADIFLRIHKSFIVSLGKVEAFTAHSVELPGKELPIGRSYKNAVFEMLQAPREV